MIKDDIIQEIVNLVMEGRFSQRKIAKLLGVSRGTVQAVAHGRRTERLASAGNAATSWIVPSGQPKRCPNCGSRAKMPCLACQLHAMQQLEGVM